MASRALVLGGGGVTGVAWEIGVLAGLAARGVQLSAADLLVGTSAGSVVGAQLACGADLAELYEEQLRPAPGAGQAGASAAVDKMKLRDLAIFGWAMLRYRDPARAGARIGRMALAARTMPEADRRAVIASRVPSEEWPARRLLITAVDAVTGEFTVFTEASGVSLVDAVGASCAVPGVWPPVTLAGRRWIDGGIRSPANADLAAECERVVVLAPIPRGMRAASAVAAQAAGLTRAGRAVAVVSPDRAAVAAIGRNVLDPARRAPAARAGHAQAGAALDRVGTVWNG
jgi:NTE family protein